VIGPAAGQKGDTANGADRRDRRYAGCAAGRAEVDRTGVGDEGTAVVAEWRKENIHE